MVEPQASRFWQAAIRSGLLDDATLRLAWDSIPHEKRTHDAIDRRLARQIVNAGKITLWQAQQMLAGRWQGLRIDRYELQDIIGHGGMGRVYLARDVKLGRKVALKILSRERMNNPRALTRFRREAKVGAQLQHENLVRIYDEGEAHGVRYLVMEFIEGKTIGKLIAEVGSLPPATAASLGRQIALGLEHLHQKGLLHRDVNPMNVMVDHSGIAKLTDLGLAIDLGDLEDIVTRDGATVGTFDYISPEQAKHSRSVDGRADLYSLGCTLYHMISGRVPFPTANLPEKLFAHQGSEPEPLAQLVPGVPDGLAGIVTKLMRKLPEERFARAIDTAKALEPYATGAIATGAILAKSELSATNHVEQQSGATPQGSDPDLDFKPEPTPPSAGTSTSKSAQPDFFPRIDLGPEPSLSEVRGSRSSKSKSSRTAEKPKGEKEAAPSSERRPRRPLSRRAILLATSIAAGLAILLLVAFNWKTFAKLIPKRTAGEVAKAETLDPDADAPKRGGKPGDISVRRGDGPEESVGSFRDAFARVGGGGSGEIILRSDMPIKAGDLKKPLMLAGGHLIIRAAEGSKPDLRVALGSSSPWIIVSPQAKLTLIGITIRVTPVPDPNAKPDPALKPPVLISAGGNIVMERCSIVLEGDNRTVRAIDAEGREARVTGCMFEGFDHPIFLGMYPSSEASFANCLFVRDVTTNPLAGWAITAKRLSAPKSGPRSIKIERCTALGAGLIAVDGFAPDAPLDVNVQGNAIRTTALVLTSIPLESLPKAISWTGKDNAYSIEGTAWLVDPLKAFDEVKGGPIDMKTWETVMTKDSGGRDQALKFAGRTSEGREVEDYAVVPEKDVPPVGADVSKIGPSAKP